jgi:hypothetical protein
MSNKIKIKNKKQKPTQQIKTSEYNQQYVLLYKSLDDIHDYMLNTTLQLNLYNAPDIDKIIEHYKELREDYISFIYVIENENLSEEKKDYYINGAVNKYNHCVSIITNLCVLKGAQIEMAMEDDNSFTNTLKAAFSANKTMIMEDDKTLTNGLEFLRKSEK